MDKRLTKYCSLCGAREGQAAFPPRKPNGKRRLCLECLAIPKQAVSSERIQRPVLLTRAAWEARRRAREKSPQTDLVDYIAKTGDGR